MRLVARTSFGCLFSYRWAGGRGHWFTVAWDARWVRWTDFRPPVDYHDAQDALCEAWNRAEAERVEVACGGGRGRSGTALACSAVRGADRLRELCPRGGRSPWRALYRQVGDEFVVAAVGPEIEVEQRGFAAACRRAEARLAEMEADTR